MKKRMYYTVFVITMLTIILTVIGVDHSFAQNAQKKLLTFATSSPGGVYYPLGGGMAVIIEKKTGFRCAAESTSASVENIRLVGSGQSDMGMGFGTIALKGVLGEKPFEQKYPIATLFNMYTSAEHIITLPGKGIKSIRDMKGKKVGLEPPGSGSMIIAKEILEASGFNLEKDLSLSYFSMAEGIQAMKDGVIDALIQHYAFPSALGLDLAASRDMILLPIDASTADKVFKKNPGYVKITIPAKTYPKVDYDVPCIGDSNMVFANSKMEDDVAYKIVEAIMDNVDKGEWALVNIHPVAKQITPQNAIVSPIKLHPGAIKYYKKVGALK